VIDVTELTKRFGTHTAVDDLSFVVKPGVVTGLLGQGSHPGRPAREHLWGTPHDRHLERRAVRRLGVRNPSERASRAAHAAVRD
jgi:hypothetical protein